MYNILFNKSPSPLILKKMTNFQNGLEWPHFTSRTSGTSHSIGFCPVLNLKTGKKISEIFNSSNPGFFMGEKSKKSRKKTIFSQRSPDLMGWKFRNDFFSIFKLSTGQKPIECDVPEVLEAKCGHFKPFWKFVIFSKMGGGFLLNKILYIFRILLGLLLKFKLFQVGYGWNIFART